MISFYSSFGSSSSPVAFALKTGGSRRLTYEQLHHKRFNTEEISRPAFLRDPSNVNSMICKVSRDGRIHAPLEHMHAPEPCQFSSRNHLETFCKQIDAFYRFTRPHTIIGSIVGITSISFLPMESMSSLSPLFFKELLKALIPALLMNIYVVGLNQIFDVEIDRVNKPSLPLASGEFSMEQGIAIVATCCILSLTMGIMSRSPPLMSALLISFVLGSAYSIDLPYLRWKRYAFLAATTILCVRALLVQLCFFLHMQSYVLARPVVLSKTVIFATIFMCFFAAVIALLKDIPDVDGDRCFGIESFSVRLGQDRVFWLCVKLLLTAYGFAMLVGTTSSSIIHKLVAVLGHGVLARILWVRAQSVDTQNKSSATSFYMFIWKLFYTEYFLIPFMR